MNKGLGNQSLLHIQLAHITAADIVDTSMRYILHVKLSAELVNIKERNTGYSGASDLLSYSN